MSEEESQCALNLRKFPKDLRRRLNTLAARREEDVQDIAPKWLGERLEIEEEKDRRKQDAKRK